MTHSLCRWSSCSPAPCLRFLGPPDVAGLIRGCSRHLSPLADVGDDGLLAFNENVSLPKGESLFSVFPEPPGHPLFTPKLWWPLARLHGNHGNSPKPPTDWPRARVQPGLPLVFIVKRAPSGASLSLFFTVLTICSADFSSLRVPSVRNAEWKRQAVEGRVNSCGS